MTEGLGTGFEPREPKTGEKVMSLDEAVKRFVRDGDSVTPCGVGVRVPFALCYEMVRQHKRDLTVCTTGAIDNLDMIIGAGCVTRLECGFTSMEGFGLPLMFKRAVEKKKLVVEDYSNLCMALRFLAGAVGLPFIPVSSVSGSDIEKLSTWRKEKKLARVKSPFTGESTLLLPPCVPDVALFHAQQADHFGNTQVWGMLGSDDWAARASKHIIVSVERLVENEEIRRNPHLTVLPDFVVDAIVEAPWGGHPWAVQGFYDVDVDFRREYAQAIRSDEAFDKWLNEWVYEVKNHTSYIHKLGKERLDKLSAKNRPYMSVPVNYGY